MKQIIFTAILIFAVSFAAFAQANENLCPKINIKFPETVQPDETFKVFAYFEKENQPSTSRFNWTVIKGTEAIKTNSAGVIEIVSKNIKNDDTIVVLAESPDEKCQDVAMAKIFVVPSCGLPFTIDEYGKTAWNEEKAHLENVAFQMQNFKDSDLFVFFNFDKRNSSDETKNHLVKVLNYLSSTGKLEKNRIRFLISESEQERTKFQPFPKDFNFDFCDNCFVIKGQDLEKIASLFEPKPKTKNQKP